MQGWLSRVSYCALVIAFAMAKAEADEPPPAGKADALVQQLGSPNFARREAAHRELQQLGIHAAAAVQQGVSSTDPEIRARCERLLPIIVTQDIRGRLNRFRADTLGQQNHGLPGWQRYQSIVGNDPKSRAFFADMLSRRMETSIFIDTKPELLGKALRKRIFEIMQERENFEDVPVQRGDGGRIERPKLSFDATEIAFWLFVCTDPKVMDSARNLDIEGRPVVGEFTLTNLLMDDLFSNALRNKEKAQPLEKLLLAWMKNLKDTPEDNDELLTMFNISRDMNMKPVLPIALDRLRKKTDNPDIQAHGLTLVGKLGSKENLVDLSPYLSKAEKYCEGNFNRQRTEVQFRDIALAMSLHLQGLKLKPFGFKTESREDGLYPYYLGFVDDDERKRAFAAYADFLYR